MLESLINIKKIINDTYEHVLDYWNNKPKEETFDSIV
jgi:hypothetical protein